MSTRINTNVTALQAAGNLNANSNALSQNIARLSSGLRINSAADDPAGLAISENFKAQISGVTQAIANNNNSINEIKTAEGALNQVQNLLVSIRQLAVHASNVGANSTVDVQADQTQINSAIASINRIASTTSFGNKKLLDGSASAATSITRGTVSSTGLSIVSAGSFNAALSGTYDTVSVAASTAASTAYGLTGGTLSSGSTGRYSGSLVISGTQYNLNTAASSTLSDLNNSIGSSGYQAAIDNTGELVFTSQSTGRVASPAAINIASLSIGTDSAIDTSNPTGTPVGANGTATLSGGTATLDTNLANDTIATTGVLVYSQNGGSSLTQTVTAGQTLSQVNSQLGSLGLTLSATSSALVVSGSGLDVSSFTGKVASTTLNTIGIASVNIDHNVTITPSGLGKLDTVAANNTLTQSGSLVYTDNGVAKTVSVSAGETWAQLQVGVTAADAGVAAAVNSNGQLVLTGGGAGHDIAVTAATNVTFGDAGVNESTIANNNNSVGTVTLSGGTASLDTTLANDTVASSGVLVYSLNGGSSQTQSITAGQTLSQVSTQLAGVGISLAATSNSLVLTGSGLSVSSFTGQVASTTLNTISTASTNIDHNVTITPSALGKLDTVAANNTLTQSGSLVYTDNSVAKTLSVSAGESWAQFQVDVTAVDAGVAAAVNSNGQLVLTGGGAGHDIAVTAATNVTFGDVGVSESTITNHNPTQGTVTLSGGTARLDTTLANDVITSSGRLVYSLNGEAAQTLSVTAGQTLAQVNTALSGAGLTLSATSSALLLTGSGNIDVTSFTGKVASSTTNTIGTGSVNIDHNITLTPSGLGALDTVAANNTVSQTGALVFTDNNGGGQTVSVTVGQTWAQFQAAVTAVDAGAVTASVNGAGQLVLTGPGAGHDINVTSSTIGFGNTGVSENVISAADGPARGVQYAQSGATTLTASSARFAGVVTVSGATGAQAVLTLSPGTSLASLNSSLTSVGAAANVDSGGNLTFYGVANVSPPTVTLGSDFSAYNSVSPSSAFGAFSNGQDAMLSLSNATNTLTSVSTEVSSDATYFDFANGLVVSSSITEGSMVANIVATGATSTRGQSLRFQVGGNSGETTSFDIDSVDTSQLGVGAAAYVDAGGTTQTVQTANVADINVLTFQGAQDALAVIDKAIDDVSTLRTELGAFQTNVLQSSVASLSVAQQNLSASLSSVEDTDLSTVIVEYTKNQILVQAGTSALGQANQAPQSILKLLQ